MSKVALINASAVQRHLFTEDVIRQVENTWRWYGEGTIEMPAKITLNMESQGIDSWMNSMPSYIKATDYVGIKWVGGFAESRAAGKPYIRASVFLADSHMGDLRAVFAGDRISDMRTGAQAAIMSKYLAAKTEIVTLIGAGVQGYWCLECMSKILDIKEARICDINPAARERMIKRFEGYPFGLIDSPDNSSGCVGSDIIITVTTANVPLIGKKDVKPGALVLTMGSFAEATDELLLGADRKITDSIAQAVHRGSYAHLAEKGLVDESSFDADISSVIVGKAKGRMSEDEIIVAPIIGMGATDAAVAAMLLEKLERDYPDEVFYFDING
ncbi:MAG: ornithine cyclodeaminase family protein [Clostridiales bacterium]|nr:ornithine cyclodeaminase family protein [Clostridiales bacterium]